MFGLGPTELVVILVVALLVLGPKRLPDLATGLGKAIRQFRRATRDLQDQIEVDDSVRQPMQELRAALRDEPSPVRVNPAPQTFAASPPPRKDEATAAAAGTSTSTTDEKPSPDGAQGPAKAKDSAA